MSGVVLFATPGMAQGAVDAAKPLVEAGWDVRYVPIGGMSQVFKHEAHKRRGRDGRVLPGLLRKWAPGVDLDAPVLFVGFSAGVWLWRDGISTHAADRAQTVGVVAIDGLHATEAQLATTRAYLEEGGHVLVLHSDTPTYGYPSTTETVQTLGAHEGLTVIHRPGGHRWSTLQSAAGISSWLADLPPDTSRSPITKRETPISLGAISPRRTWLGDKGPDVERWQELLAVGGYYDAPLDGAHGPVTERATIHYLGEAYDPGDEQRLGLRCCEWLGYQLTLDPREIRGADHNELILSYSEHCRRGGALLGIDHDGEPLWRGGVPLRAPSDEWAWCAIFQSAALLACLKPGERPPHGLRVAVRELVEDGREAGTLYLAGSGYVPKPGDLAIEARAGESPLRGGRGHVWCVTSYVPGASVAAGIGGNEGDRIQFRADRPLDRVIAWVAR